MGKTDITSRHLLRELPRRILQLAFSRRRIEPLGQFDPRVARARQRAADHLFREERGARPTCSYADDRRLRPVTSFGAWLTNELVNRMLCEMVTFNIYEAKTQLSKLIRRVRAGQEVIIADAGTPVAKLVPIEQPKAARVLGSDRGKIWVAPDAFDPLAREDLAAWDGPLFPESPKRQQRPQTGHPRSQRGTHLRARR